MNYIAAFGSFLGAGAFGGALGQCLFGDGPMVFVGAGIMAAASLWISWRYEAAGAREQ